MAAYHMPLSGRSGLEGNALTRIAMRAVLAILLFVPASIFALEDGHWLPLVLIPAVGLGGEVVVRAWTRQAFESTLFAICFSSYELAAAVTFLVNREIYKDDFAQPDSHLFFNLASGQFGHIPLVPFLRINGVGIAESVLSPFLAQYYIAFARFFDPSSGTWPALTGNIVVMATALVFTTRAARHCFPTSFTPVRFAAVFSLLCPIFLLYGVEFLRDGYAILLVSVMLFGATGWAHVGGWRRLLLFGSLLLASSYFMVFVRVEMLFIPALIVVAAITAKLCYGRRTHLTALILAISGAVFVAFLAASMTVLSQVGQVILNHEKVYASLAAGGGGDSSSSLGLQLLAQLSIPLRLVLGPILMTVNPIPLWAFFSSDFMPAFWLRSLNGMLVCAIVPLGIAGLFSLKGERFRDHVCQRALLVVALTFIGGLLAISLTSLEIRHLSAFYPAFFILAAAPFAMGPAIQPLTRSIAKFWYGGVLLIHLAWAMLKLLL